MRTRDGAVLAIALTLIGSYAGAPFFGYFPGLDKLIDWSQHIVVATITSEPEHADITNGAIYSIKIESVIKGNARPGDEPQIYLQWVPYSRSRFSHPLMDHRFMSGEKFVFFLNDPDVKLGTSGLPKNVRYKSLSTGGDSFWVPGKLPQIDGSTPREKIESLVKARLDFEDLRLKDLHGDAEEYLGKGS